MKRILTPRHAKLDEDETRRGVSPKGQTFLPFFFFLTVSICPSSVNTPKARARALVKKTLNWDGPMEMTHSGRPGLEKGVFAPVLWV